jgi:disulfide bond formation protein DsbB
MSSLKLFSTKRLSWLLLLLTVLALEGTALFFQHVMKLEPCVMCIYERVALFGIGGAAIIGFLNPKFWLFRWAGLLIWIYAAFEGLMLSYQHYIYQVDTSPFGPTCDLFVQFPSWLPLNNWMPWLFDASGDCSKVMWSFFSLSMTQWLIIIFAVFLIVAIIFVIAQLAKLRRQF